MTKCALPGCDREAKQGAWGDRPLEFRTVNASGSHAYCSEEHWERDKIHPIPPPPASERSRVTT